MCRDDCVLQMRKERNSVRALVTLMHNTHRNDKMFVASPILSGSFLVDTSLPDDVSFLVCV